MSLSHAVEAIIDERARQLKRLRARAITIGRELARARGETYLETFADSLRGELARRLVVRRLRRENPGIEVSRLDAIVEEELSP